MPAKPKPRYHKTKRSWYFVHHGKQKSLGPDEAKAWATFRELTGEPAGTDKPHSIVETVDRWLELKPSTDERYRLRRWLRFSAKGTLRDIDVDHLERFAAYLATTTPQPGNNHKKTRTAGFSPKTIRDTLNSTRRVLQWCVDHGWIDRMPRLPSVPRPVRQPKDLSQDQLEIAWDALPKHARPILTFILETGCRPSEACGLRWDHVDLEKGLCTLGQHKTARHGRVRIIGVTPAAREILEALPQRTGPVFTSRLGSPYTAGGLRSILRRRGIDKVYALRHTRAQRMLDDGASLHDVAALLGHADLSTVGVYAEVRAERLRAIAKEVKPIISKRPH